MVSKDKVRICISISNKTLELLEKMYPSDTKSVAISKCILYTGLVEGLKLRKKC